MNWFTRSSRFSLVALALTMGLTVNIPLQVQVALASLPMVNQLPNQWEPPGTPISGPVDTESGGSRGPCLPDPNTNKVPIALLPHSGVGTTIADYPTVSWYIPKTTAWGVEFQLRDANKKLVYSTTYAFAHYTEQTNDGTSQEFVVGTPGIMSLSLPASSGVSPVEIGKEYSWQLTLKCDEIDRSGDLVVDGGFKRVQADPNLASRIQQAKPEDLVAIYAQERLWYETLNTLIDLRRAQPNDRNFTNAWNKLLKSAGLDRLTEESLFQEARTVNNR